ncbi:sentrin-specific protease 1-like [Argopecten irradians]|uniref:sentrin-specific protease 1-like n=1 Tax=Argopecten irradians TaxID=31199 RepID=UPI0037218FB8
MKIKHAHVYYRDSISFRKRKIRKEAPIPEDAVPERDERDWSSTSSSASDVSILPTIPDLANVWRYHNESTSMMSMIGPYKLRGNSFGSLKPGNEISDEIINAYMHILSRNNLPRVRSIDCFISGSIMPTGLTEKLPKVDPYSHQILLCPFNSGSHWEIFVVFSGEKNGSLIHLVKVLTQCEFISDVGGLSSTDV